MSEIVDGKCWCDVVLVVSVDIVRPIVTICEVEETSVDMFAVDGKEVGVTVRASVFSCKVGKSSSRTIRAGVSSQLGPSI